MHRGKPPPFYEKPKFAVSNPYRFWGSIPEHVITAEWGEQIALYLASEGYFQGDPYIVYKRPVGLVLDTYYYSVFKKDMANTIRQLNADEGNR